MKFPAVTLVLLLLLCSGCETRLPLPDLEIPRRLVLLGELVANDSTSFRVGQSIPVNAADPAINPVPQGCAATVFQNGAVFFQSAPYTDSLARFLNTLVVTNSRRLQPGNTYDLKVTGTGFDEASAQVKIPRAFTAAITDTATVLYGGLPCLEVKMRIYDPLQEENYYIVEALRQPIRYTGTFDYNGTTHDLIAEYERYDSLVRNGQLVTITAKDSVRMPQYERLEMYTRDAGTENVKIANPFTVARRILRNDIPDGQASDLTFYIRKERFTGHFPDDIGAVVITVKSVSKDYFGYLRAYETFTPTNSTGFLAQPVRIDGNVKGGLGVVGGVFAIPFRYFFEKTPR